MRVEFHYYLIHYLANKAGFNSSEAYKIAYSSQFVDNNLIEYHVKTEKGIYTINPTQNYGFWSASFPKKVYIPFHFFPGDIDHPGAERNDKRRNKLNCTPNSTLVKKLLISALKTKNLYRAGIAFHTFADSWAHQNFSGILESWNQVDEVSPIPSMGHAQAISKPDKLWGVWEDNRLIKGNTKIFNYNRFFEAGKKIYKYMCIFNRKDYTDIDTVFSRLNTILGVGRKKTSAEWILDLIIEEGITEYNRKEWFNEAVVTGDELIDEKKFGGYDKLMWLKDAVLYRSSLIKKNAVPALKGFYNSNLYNWHEAAMAHLKDAGDILDGLI